MVLAMIPIASHALPSSHFTNKSRLANGRWVKVAVTRTGIHQITIEQLQQMGFSGTSNIQVYGTGGVMLSTVLDPSLPDDLSQVPVLRLGDKICFYASGILNYNLVAAPNPHYMRTRNTYSQRAYYFITEDSHDSSTPATHNYSQPATPTTRSTSLDVMLHESEAISVAFTGSELLGEKLSQPVEFTLINPSDKRIGLTSRVAAKVARRAKDSNITVSGRFSCQLTVGQNTIKVPYSDAVTTIPGAPSEYTYYQLNPNPDQNMVWVDLPDTCHRGVLKYAVSVMPSVDDAVSRLELLDYFLVTYNHYNRLAGQQGAQCLMGFTSTTAADIVQVDENNLTVWDVTTPTAPVTMLTRNAGSHTQFTPGAVSTPRLYVAFDPAADLYDIDGYELVENQNLHAQPVPDLLIVTRHEFMPQAERVAQLHRQKDGMRVLVLDQEQIFNEFSAGTPDAMAIRLLCKMFYDRDNTRFKHLLLFGNVSFDNRGIVTGKKNTVVSFVSDASNNEDNGYINDDFYGYLIDGSGQNIAADRLCIGVGHMPVANAEEAAEAVDKLYGYVYSTDYGPWRNNYALMAENSTFKQEGQLTKTDGNGNIIYQSYQLHESQAAGIGRIIDEDGDTRMMRDLAFVKMFPLSVAESFKAENKRSSDEGARHVTEMLSNGQYFMTYVGHANASTYALSGLWNTNHVRNTSYARLPIMTTACCDVARFDSDSRGIAELMFHKRDGGAIALYTTTRQVLATLNDDLNRAFVGKMFSYNTTGVMPRLGDCYMASKNYYNRSNSNKLHWVLLGDPALQVNYPKPLFSITAINGTSLSTGNSIGVAPLQRVTIDAQVMSEGTATVNTAFNGDATITIYDAETVFMPYVRGTGKHLSDTTSLGYPRERLVQVTGRVRAGRFHGSVVMPRFARPTGNMLVSVYAHQDGTDNMVSGSFDRLQKKTYNAATAVTDDQAPVIQAMYLNNEQEFAANATVGSEATLYIRATDDCAFNTQQQAMGCGIKLTLDGGKATYNLAKNLARVTDEGRRIDIAMPLTGLTVGQHTLDFTVADVCGNTTSQRITFVVSTQSDLRLTASDIAASDHVTIDLADYTLSSMPSVNLRVTDLDGNLVWSRTTSTFPCTWALTDNAGTRVPNGLYRIYANYTATEGYGGSNLIDFIVLPPIN